MMRAAPSFAAAIVLFALIAGLAAPTPRAAAQDPALIEQGQRAFMKQGCYASYLRPCAHMPALELTDDDIRAIASFLATRQ